MDWGFSIVAPAATVVGYLANGRTTDWATLDVLNLVEMVLLILLSFQALEQRPNNIVTQPGQVFFNNNLVVGFYIVATFVYAVRVLSIYNTGAFDLVPFFLYLTIALQCKQQNGRILAWLLFAIASWRFAWYAYTSYVLHKSNVLRNLLQDTSNTENVLTKEHLEDLAQQMGPQEPLPSLLTQS